MISSSFSIVIPSNLKLLVLSCSALQLDTANFFSFCSFRRASISGLKCLIRPCTGHAAPSAKAQIVCNSICFVSSHSMSISCTSALPSMNLQGITTRLRIEIICKIIYYTFDTNPHLCSILNIQLMPSRQGVHWPQDSCL